MTNLFSFGSWLTKLPVEFQPKKCAGAALDCSHTPRFGRQPDGVRLQGEWYCSAACFERGVLAQLRKLRALCFRRAVNHRIPLGLLLLSQGVITRAQLSHALSAQRTAGEGKLGGWLRQSGAVGEYEITKALSQQWSCPVMKSCSPNLHSASLLPFTLLEWYRMVPFHFSAASSTMYLAFSDQIPYPVLSSIERMLNCRTEACLATPSETSRSLDELRKALPPREAMFDRRQPDAEMAAAVRSYALECSAHDVRISNCGDFIWVRLFAKKHFDVLFRTANILTAADN